MSGPNSYLSEPAPEYAEVKKITYSITHVNTLLTVLGTQLLKVMNPLPDLASLGATIEEARKNFVSFTNPSRSVGHIPTIGLAVKEFKILTRDGYSLPVRSYIPEPQDSLGEDKNTTWPALVWGHHGGWIFGGLDSDDTTCRVLATSLRIAVLNVEFRKSPEYVFPSAVNDMHDSVRWVRSSQFHRDPLLCRTFGSVYLLAKIGVLQVAANPEKLQAGLTKGFIIAGVSAGANMAAVVAHLARDEKLSPPLTGQLLSQGTYFSRKHLDFVPKEFHAEYTSDIDNKDAAIINSKSAEFIFSRLILV